MTGRSRNLARYTVAMMDSLAYGGVAHCYFGETLPRQTARQRLANAARRLGVRVTIKAEGEDRMVARIQKPAGEEKGRIWAHIAKDQRG